MPIRLFLAAFFLVSSGFLLSLPAFAGTEEVGSVREIILRLNPDSREIQVHDRFTISSDVISFELAPWMELEKASIGEEKIDADRDGDRITLSGLTPPAELSMELRGLVPDLPRIDGGGIFQPAFVDPEGSYLSGTVAWMAPVREKYRLTIEVPPPYRAVATGRLEREELGSGTNTAVFLSEGPIEAPTVFAGPYQVKEREIDGLRLRTYFHRTEARLALDYLKKSKDYIRRYSDLIGPYPYSGFSVVSAPVPVGLGFSGSTYVSRRILPLPFMRGRSLAHEVLHNWWGNAVGVDYARGNWSEGLTTYLADYALAEDAGDESVREMRLGWLRNLTALQRSKEFAVIDFVSKTHDRSQAIGYDKTAMIFHMLRNEVGEDAFRAGLKLFWREHRFSSASWSDLQKAFERTAEKDLGWFFEQWLTRPGLPQISLERVELSHDEGANGFIISVILSQSAPVYRLRIPANFIIGGKIVKKDFILTYGREAFEVSFEQQPSAIHIDSGFDLARKLLPGESPPIMRDVTLSDKTRVLVHSSDAEIQGLAARLAQRMLQREFAFIASEDAEAEMHPVLIIGRAWEIEAFREQHLQGQGPSVAQEGDARSWAEKGPNDAPWLFVSVDNSESFEQILRALPHYKSRSYVVFDEGKAVFKGIWPTENSPLSRWLN